MKFYMSNTTTYLQARKIKFCVSKSAEHYFLVILCLPHSQQQMKLIVQTQWLSASECNNTYVVAGSSCDQMTWSFITQYRLEPHKLYKWESQDLLADSRMMPVEGVLLCLIYLIGLAPD